MKNMVSGILGQKKPLKFYAVDQFMYHTINILERGTEVLILNCIN